MIAAAKKTDAWEWIAKLPQGFDTVIGESGLILSEEQKKIIALMRVWLINPELLILDEFNNSSDTVFHRALQSATR